jgi:hypothetical protein
MRQTSEMSGSWRTKSYLFLIIEQEHEPSPHHLIKVRISITSAGLGPCPGHICDFDVSCLSRGSALISGSLPNLRLNRPSMPDHAKNDPLRMTPQHPLTAVLLFLSFPLSLLVYDFFNLN